VSYVDPITDEEWKAAALVARGALLFHSAKAYGLVSGGPVVDVPRCEELLARALARGIEIDDHDAALAFVAECNSENER
jgi:hypothetical protein